MNMPKHGPMRLLHIDSSARTGISGEDPRGSHSRRLSRHFMDRWKAARPGDIVCRRDVAALPPAPVDEAWIDAAFTPQAQRSPGQTARLAESDRLAGELLAADLLVVGVPMYNFGVPSPLKAWIDNIVRVGMTFGFDRARVGEPYWPMVPAGKRLVILTSRGDYGYAPGERLAAMNVVEAGLKVPLRYIGITESDTIAIEYDEFGDDRLAASIAAAEAAVETLVGRLLGALSA
ncbi:FMN-dependent NADH-azoreductase [Sphingomonas sp. RS6]